MMEWNRKKLQKYIVLSTNKRIAYGHGMRGKRMREEKKLSLLEVFGLSIAVVAPTGAMAFNTAGTAAATGSAIPLAFILGGLGIFFVGISFVELAHHIPGEGSAYAYNSKAFGERIGFLSGWALTLTYIAFTVGCVSIFSNFADVFLKHFDISIPIPVYIVIALVAGWWLSHKGIEFSTRFALILELISVAALAILALIIIFSGGNNGNSVKPFTLSGTPLSGLGTGMVFALLSFAGFEGAATVAPQAKKPKKAITVAILGTVIFAVIFYVIVSYAQVIGFGTKNIAKLANSSAPLNYLATRYVGSYMAVFIDFASCTSFFACYLGAMNAAAFMMKALADNGYLTSWFSVDRSLVATPKHALDTVSVIALVAYIIFGLRVGPTNFYNYCGTLGTLSLLLVYVMVNIGAIKFFVHHREYFSFWKHLFSPIMGTCVLIYPIYSNLWPVPDFPMNLFPYIVVVWILIGWVVSYKRRLN